MSEQPWGVGADSPMNEGSEPTAVGDGSIGERRAAEGAGSSKTDKPLAYDPDEEHQPQAGEQGGQPNLSPDPAVAGRPSRFGQGSTDDSPGTPSGL
ncbi:hypothetical protein [Actinoplanes sp. M2I2]|uniref:hypothetical protein n=1 Tax=Actinoplanes sp. M2I2 TaxID=1734444 RepID=UPI00202107D6|nr:hypothetical protein [Actinoplanes sp. M2I2]